MTKFRETAKRAIVCCNCNRPIAFDYGRSFDRALVMNAVNSHLGHPRSEITVLLNHQLVTVDLVNKTCAEGLSFESEIVL